MNLRSLLPLHLLAFTASVALSVNSAFGQNAALADVEAQKCQEKIVNVQRDTLNHYDDALQELQLTSQKAADLESALIVRAERQRLAAEVSLSEKNLVTDPKSLRALQIQTIAKMNELVSQLIGETMPKLIEIKKSLTVAGKLEDAVAVRNDIEQLQNTFMPTAHPDPATVVPAENLLKAYATDRPHADKQYKGQHFIVHGLVGGFQADPADPKSYLIYLSGNGAGTSWVQCSLSTAEYHFREEKQFNYVVLGISSKEDPSGVHIQKGQAIDLRGICDGWDEAVKFVKCELVK